MWVHEAIAASLAEWDVPMFGVVGDGNLFIADALERLRPGAYVAMSNESGVVQAASGYAQRARTVGIATVTHGPGLTNTITALVEAVRAGSPVVLVAGETATDDEGNLQRIDQSALVAATGARFHRMDHAGEATWMLAAARREALRDRVPVVVSIPYDLVWLLVPDTGTHGGTCPASEDREVSRQVIDEQVIAAAQTLAGAKRPAILAGRGAVDAEVEDDLVAIARRIGALTATSLRGKGMFDGEPFHLGVSGGLGDAAAMDELRASDVVLAVGVSLNPLTTDGGTALSGTLIHIESGGEVRAGVLHADARTAIPALRREIERLVLVDRAPRTAPPAAESPAPGGDTGRISIVDAMAAIESAVPVDRTLVMDGGRFFFEAARRLSVPSAGAYVHTASFAAIGMGMSAAIGAALAAPERRLLLVTGDGGFMLGGLVEFATAVRLDLDMLVVVINDAAYGAEVVQLEAHDRSTDIARLHWPDLGPVADALGGTGRTVRSLPELTAALADLAHVHGPSLLDVHIDPDGIPWPFHKRTRATA